MTVIEHGTVGYAIVRVGIVFKVLIVSGDHTPRLFLHKLVKHSLSHSSTDLRLCTRTKLVDKQKRTVIGLAHHVLHVEQV